MTIENAVKFGTGQFKLLPSPINASWILEGAPVARNKMLSTSADGTASTLLWECTAGKFNWHYDIDETVYVLEGSVIVKDQVQGTVRNLRAGDTAFFPAGSSAEWTVESYVRKVAFCRAPLPRKILVAKKIYQCLKRLVRPVSRKDEGKGAMPAMFHSG